MGRKTVCDTWDWFRNLSECDGAAGYIYKSFKRISNSNPYVIFFMDKMDDEAFYKICASVLNKTFAYGDGDDLIKIDGEIIDLFNGRSEDRLKAKKKVLEILGDDEMVDLIVKEYVEYYNS